MKFDNDIMTSFLCAINVLDIVSVISHYASRGLSENSVRYDIILHATMF